MIHTVRVAVFQNGSVGIVMFVQLLIGGSGITMRREAGVVPGGGTSSVVATTPVGSVKGPLNGGWSNAGGMVPRGGSPGTMLSPPMPVSIDTVVRGWIVSRMWFHPRPPFSRQFAGLQS